MVRSFPALVAVRHPCPKGNWSCLTCGAREVPGTTCRHTPQSLLAPVVRTIYPSSKERIASMSSRPDGKILRLNGPNEPQVPFNVNCTNSHVKGCDPQSHRPGITPGNIRKRDTKSTDDCFKPATRRKASCSTTHQAKIPILQPYRAGIYW